MRQNEVKTITNSLPEQSQVFVMNLQGNTSILANISLFILHFLDSL